MAASDLPDYRKPEQKKFGLHFGGNFLIAIAIFLGLGGFVEVVRLQGTVLGLPLIIIPTLYYIAHYTYFASAKIAAVSDATPPDLSPPQSGHMRVTILRRQATYVGKSITGRIVDTTTHDELIVWVILSEVAKKIIEKHDLMDADVYVTPIAKETLDFYRSLDPELAREKFVHHRVNDFLIDPPYLTWDRDYVEEPLIREGLKNLNDTIIRLLTSPTSSSKSFEL